MRAGWPPAEFDPACFEGACGRMLKCAMPRLEQVEPVQFAAVSRTQNGYAGLVSAMDSV